MKRKVFRIIQPSDGYLPSRIFDLAIMALIAIGVMSVFAATFQLQKGMVAVMVKVELVTSVIFSVEYALRVWTADMWQDFHAAESAPKRVKFAFERCGGRHQREPEVGVGGTLAVRQGSGGDARVAVRDTGAVASRLCRAFQRLPMRSRGAEDAPPAETARVENTADTPEKPLLAESRQQRENVVLGHSRRRSEFGERPFRERNPALKRGNRGKLLFLQTVHVHPLSHRKRTGTIYQRIPGWDRQK